MTMTPDQEKELSANALEMKLKAEQRIRRNNRRRLVAAFKRLITGARFEYVVTGRREVLWRVALADGRRTGWTDPRDVDLDPLGRGLATGESYISQKLAFETGRLLRPDLMLIDFGRFLAAAKLPMRELMRVIHGGAA